MILTTDPACLAHRTPFGFPERPERLERILEAWSEAGRPVQEPGPHPRTEEAVVAVHGEDHVRRFRRAVERGDGLFGSADTPVSPGTAEAAEAAVAAGLGAADRIAEGARDPVFVAVRPPGHHAERELAMGFCYFNTVVVVVEHLRAIHGVERVAIFDFDVHHGNGTQHLFEADPDVIYASTHQYPFYPGTGAASETGKGPGEGATVNVPLPAGTDDRGYEEAIRETVIPAIVEHGPEILVVSAGFDSWKRDPLGGMKVSRDGFRSWGRWLRALVDERCDGRMLVFLEGGYDLDALGSLVVAFADGIDGGGRPSVPETEPFAAGGEAP